MAVEDQEQSLECRSSSIKNWLSCYRSSPNVLSQQYRSRSAW